MSTDLVASTSTAVESRFSSEEVELIKDTICKGATDSELKLFLQVCNRTQLDPFARQIYSVARWDGRLQREVRQTQTSIDGLRLVAERTGKYAGQEGPWWCGKDGKWVDVWLVDEHPAAARATVLKVTDGRIIQTSAVARWDSYVQKTSKGAVTRMWLQMGDVMLAKCAEALALRKTFPQELSGLYTAEEMAQADNPKDADDNTDNRATGTPPTRRRPPPSSGNALVQAATEKAEAERDAAKAALAEGPIPRADEMGEIQDDDVEDAEIVEEGEPSESGEPPPSSAPGFAGDPISAQQWNGIKSILRGKKITEEADQLVAVGGALRRQVTGLGDIDKSEVEDLKTALRAIP